MKILMKLYFVINVDKNFNVNIHHFKNINVITANFIIQHH